MKKINPLYPLMFILVVSGVVYLSIPSERTLVAMSRDDDDAQRTRQLLERRVQREPENVGAALELADFHDGRAGADAAFTVLEEAHARFPDDARVQKRLGMILLRRMETDRALAMVPEDRRDGEFYRAAADNRELEGDLARAEAMLLAAGEDTPAVWKRVALWRWQMYETDGAAEALRRALALRPDDREALEAYFTNRAWALDAAEAIRTAAELEKTAPLGRMHLDAVHFLQMSIRDLDGAAESLQKLAALPDATPADAVTLGVFLYDKGDIAKSNEMLLTLAETPNLPQEFFEDAFARLEYSAAENRNIDLARRLTDLAAGRPDLAESARVTVVDVAMALGRFDEAAAAIEPLAASPGAGIEVLQTALELTYRMDALDKIPPLHRRLADAGVPVDELTGLIPGDETPLAEWRREMDGADGSRSPSYALAGWMKAAMRGNDANAAAPGTAVSTPPAELAAAVDRLLPLLDGRALLTVAVAAEALSVLSDTEPDEAVRQKRLEQAAALFEQTPDTILAGSAALMTDAAAVNERLGRMEEAERFWRLAAQADRDNPWSGLGLARAAARRGDEMTVEDAIRSSEARGAARTAAEIRSLVDVCLGLVDVLSEDKPDAARHWLDRARGLVAANDAVLAADDIENIILRADVAERSGDAEAMFALWGRVARREPDRLDAWLGLARGAILLERPDAAWEAARRARGLLDAADTATQTQVAWQMLAAADATPEDSPRRPERLAASLAYARETLTRAHDDALAQSVFWRLLEEKDLTAAGSYIGSGADAPTQHAALAEAWLAESRTKEATAHALAAAASDDRDVSLRMALVLTETEEKDRARDLLARVEASPGEETPEYLLQLADAYGALEMYDRQFALMEIRARAGGEKEWMDAVDRRVWAGDNAGAAALLRQATERFPRSTAVLDRTIAFMADNNRPGDALATFRKALEVMTDAEGGLSADALAALGVASDDVRQTPAARRFFRLSFAKDEKNKRACMGYARLLRRDGNLGGAIVQLRRYVDGTPDDPWGWLELANTRALADQSGRAEYREVVRLTEPDAKGEIPTDVRAARAVALRALGREKEALALLRGTMGPDITNPDIACDFAQMLMEIRQYDEAERILRDTVKVFPYHVWAYRLEATILVRRQKYDLAVARLKEALEWAPRDGEVQRDLGFAAQLWERTWASQKGWLTAGGR